MPCAIMARGSPWVTPSLLCKKWPDPSPVSLTTSVAQWRYHLNVNCAPLGHSCRTAQSMAVRFSSLNAFRASMRRKPQSSSFLCSSQKTRIAWMAPSIPASSPPASCVVPQAALASGPATLKRHFAIICLHVSPTPTGLIHGCLSSAISRPLMSARLAAQGGCPFQSHSTKYPIEEAIDDTTGKPLISDTSLCALIPKNVRKILTGTNIFVTENMYYYLLHAKTTKFLSAAAYKPFKRTSEG